MRVCSSLRKRAYTKKTRHVCDTCTPYTTHIKHTHQLLCAVCAHAVGRISLRLCACVSFAQARLRTRFWCAHAHHAVQVVVTRSCPSHGRRSILFKLAFSQVASVSRTAVPLLLPVHTHTAGTNIIQPHSLRCSYGYVRSQLRLLFGCTNGADLCVID